MYEAFSYLILADTLDVGAVGESENGMLYCCFTEALLLMLYCCFSTLSLRSRTVWMSERLARAKMTPP